MIHEPARPVAVHVTAASSSSNDEDLNPPTACGVDRAFGVLDTALASQTPATARCLRSESPSISTWYLDGPTHRIPITAVPLHLRGKNQADLKKYLSNC